MKPIQIYRSAYTCRALKTIISKNVILADRDRAPAAELAVARAQYSVPRIAQQLPIEAVAGAQGRHPALVRGDRQIEIGLRHGRPCLGLVLGR